MEGLTVPHETGYMHKDEATDAEVAPGMVNHLLPEGMVLKHEGALYKGLTKYQHIERLGHEEVEGLLDATQEDPLIIQNKIDGANMTVAWDPEEGLLIASRNQMVIVGDKWKKQDRIFTEAGEYIQAHTGLMVMLTNPLYAGWVLRGEWLVKHSVAYNQDAYRQFYVFDVQVDGKYLPPGSYISILQEHGIPYIRSEEQLTQKPDLNALVALSKGSGYFGEPQKEGIVLKRYGFRNKFGRTQWGKIVSADFAEKKKMVFGAAKRDAAELRLASKYVTQELVTKTIHKVADARDETPRVQHMAEVLQRVWYDLFMEELWDFVKKENVGAFNFRDAYKLSVNKTREIALDFYNGVPTIEVRV